MNYSPSRETELLAISLVPSRETALLAIEDVEELEKVIPLLSEAYFNDEPLVSDIVFDKLVEKLKKKKPKSTVLKRTGAPVRADKIKVKLPFWMGGMDKMKPDSNELRLYFNRTKPPYLLSDKIDGAACLLEYKNGELKGIYTRGEKGIGQDLKFLIGYLKVPLKIKTAKNVFIKGELNVLLKDYIEKFREEATKSRGVVTGVFNSLEPNLDIVSSLRFIAFGISIAPLKTELKPSKQFLLLENLGFKTPCHKIVKEVDSKTLEKYLEVRKKKSLYEIDGIIVASDYEYEKIKKDNPKHAIAFKINEEGVKTEVLEVFWEPTKHGILFPVVQVKPVVLEGDTVKNSSGKNAKYISENNIGAGAIVSLVKSGGVIPEIIEVFSETKAQFPKVKYHWDENKVNIVLDNFMNNVHVKIKRILHFYTALDVVGLKEGNVVRFYENGLNSIVKINNASVEDILEIEGFKEKSALKIYEAIHKKIDNPINLWDLMFASLCFNKGLGPRRLKLLVQKIPSLYNLEIPSKEDILEIDGFGEIVSEQFLEGMVKFKKFVKSHSTLSLVPSGEALKIKKDLKSENLYVLFSGFRDKELEEKLVSEGATIEKSFTRKVNLLIVDDIDSSSSKITKARENNIKIISRDKNLATIK